MCQPQISVPQMNFQGNTKEILYFIYMYIMCFCAMDSVKI